MEIRKSVRILDDFAYGIIKERRQDPAHSEYSDLVSRYLLLKDEEGKPYSDKYIRDIIINFMYDCPFSLQPPYQKPEGNDLQEPLIKANS